MGLADIGTKAGVVCPLTPFYYLPEEIISHQVKPLRVCVAKIIIQKKVIKYANPELKRPVGTTYRKTGPRVRDDPCRRYGT